MFCYQCEQTFKGAGCTIQGVCGKKPEVSALQDLLMYALMGLSQVAHAGRQIGITDSEVNTFTVKSAFSTLTNVNFDPECFQEFIKKTVELRDNLKEKIGRAGEEITFSGDSSSYIPPASLEELISEAENYGIKSYPTESPDILSLKHTVLYGIKGVSAYADHAQILEQTDDFVYAYVHEGLAASKQWSWTVTYC